MECQKEKEYLELFDFAFAFAEIEMLQTEDSEKSLPEKHLPNLNLQRNLAQHFLPLFEAQRNPLVVDFHLFEYLFQLEEDHHREVHKVIPLLAHTVES